MYYHMNPWANLHLLGQPNTFLARKVRYRLELALGLPEDRALRAAGAALLARLLVHDPRARASWPEFFGCEFMRAEEPPL